MPLALALAVASISFAAVFFRLASATHPLVVSGVRLLIAAGVLLVPTLRAWRAGRLPWRTVRVGLVCGLLYAVHFGSWVTSLSMTSVASSVTLVTATPLMLASVALVTGRDRATRRHWISMALAIVGLSVIGWADSGGEGALAGDALALFGASAMAGYLLLVRRLGRQLDVLAFSGISTAVGGLSLLGAAVVTRVPIEVAEGTWLWIALAALVPQLIGHTLLTWALRYATPTAVGIATVGEPVGATLLAWLWLGDTVTPWIAVGCAVTLCAVMVAMVRLGEDVSAV